MTASQNAGVVMDDAGRLIDQISIVCLRSLKRMDERKAKVRS